MTNQDRFNNKKYPFKFTGEGKIEDNKRSLDIDAKFMFNGKIKEIDKLARTITFDLVGDEYNSLWEMVVLDGELED